MCGEKFDGAILRELRRRFVVMDAVGASERMIDIGINLDRDIWILRHAAQDFRLRFRADEAIFGRHMHEQGATNIRNFVQHIFKPNAVIADTTIDISACHQQIGELAAQTIADSADRAIADFMFARCGHCCQQVGDALLDIERTIEREGSLHRGLGLVSQFDAGFQAPEEIGANGQITLLGEVVADTAHRGIDAKNLLTNDNRRRTGMLRTGTIGVENLTVEGRDGKHVGHRRLSWLREQHTIEESGAVDKWLVKGDTGRRGVRRAETRESTMKFTMNVECSPEEARAFFGLPDVQPMQERLMADLEQQLRANVRAMDPESIARTWFPAGLQNFEQMQKLFWGQMQQGLGSFGGTTRDDKS